MRRRFIQGLRRLGGVLLASSVSLPILASPYSSCIDGCTTERNTCMAGAHSIAEHSQCAAALRACTADCQRTFPQGPAPTQVGSIQPLWGWSGDSVRITGNSLFDHLSITVGGQVAAITSTNNGVSSRAFDIVDFRIPDLHSTVLGPVSFPIVVKTATRQFAYTFDYSPMIQATASRELTPGGGFIGMGYIWTNISVNRESGQITAVATAANDGGPFDALPFTVAAAFFDADGKPLGSMLTRSFSAPGVPPLTSGPRQSDFTWVDNLRPATPTGGLNANRIRFAVLRISLTPAQELDAKILNLISFGTTMESFVTIAF